MSKYLTFCDTQGLSLLTYMENKCDKYAESPPLGGLSLLLQS